MAQGFAPALLTHLQSVMQEQYPGAKITPNGFLKALIQNNPNLQVASVNGESLAGGGMKLNTLGGQIREVKLKYLPRIIESQVEETDNCDNDQIFSYTEMTLSTPKFAKFSFFLDWATVEKYQADAVQSATIGATGTGVLQEVLAQLMHSVNGIVSKIDSDLLGQVVWGVNQTTGNNNAKTVNFNKDKDVMNLSDGINEIMYDAMENEIIGDPIIVGSGLFTKYQIKGLETAPYSYYHDTKAATAWGANEIGVFAKGSVGLVDIDRYIAFKNIVNFGNSTFTTITLPVETAAGIATTMTFNLQIKQIDCPTTLFNGYEEVTTDRGYQVIVTKRYGLFQQPTNALQAGDRLAGTNGALRYEITNNCDSCPAAE